MALLASCWLIIEIFIIPHGFLKWFFLSFYIHPIFLAFCQIYLWLKELHRCLLLLFYFPLKTAYNYLSNKVTIFFFSPTKTTIVEVFYDALDQEIPTQDCATIVLSCNIKAGFLQSRVYEIENVSKIGPIFSDTYEATQEMDDQSSSCTNDSSWLNEYLSSDHYNSCLLTYDIEFSSSGGGDFSPISDLDVNISLSTTDDDCYTLSAATDLLVDDLPAFCRSNSPVKDIDPFNQKFSERMRFFDALYQERLYGMNAILDDHLTTPGLFTSTESSTDLSMQYIISCSRMAKKRLLRILECDFELIYVAQLCLFWEALHHQYQKVEALILSDNSENRLFHHNVSGKFQEFQIQLERFVEDQKCEGQRHSNYTHKRLSFQGQLRVPDITGFMEENNSMGEEGIRASQVLKAIEKCIKAFWLYVKTDSKISLWKYKGIWRTDPLVEDPRDLELLYNVTKALHKKEIMLKDLQGKNKCWLRRKVKPLQAQENEKINLVFAMMDMKLVQRLLKMPLISTSHLKWCQEKLNNLEFRQGNIFRGPTSHLFPSS